MLVAMDWGGLSSAVVRLDLALDRCPARPDDDTCAPCIELPEEAAGGEFAMLANAPLAHPQRRLRRPHHLPSPVIQQRFFRSGTSR